MPSFFPLHTFTTLGTHLFMSLLAKGKQGRYLSTRQEKEISSEDETGFFLPFLSVGKRKLGRTEKANIGPDLHLLLFLEERSGMHFSNEPRTGISRAPGLYSLGGGESHFRRGIKRHICDSNLVQGTVMQCTYVRYLCMQPFIQSGRRLHPFLPFLSCIQRPMGVPLLNIVILGEGWAEFAS